MKAPTRIFVIDPHELMRAGIRLACDSKEHLEIIGEADNFQRGRQLASETSPDVIILDLPTCGHADLAFLRDLHREVPEARILVFTAVDEADIASHLIAAGAAGYLVKIAGLDEISVAIQCVHLGRTFISHTRTAKANRQGCDVPSNAVRSAVGAPPSDIHATSDSGALEIRMVPGRDTIAVAHSASLLSPKSAILSQREGEVLAFLADGLTNKQAAERMYLSVKTVETYRSRIMRKYGLRDRSDLVQFARHTANVKPNQAG